MYQIKIIITLTFLTLIVYGENQNIDCPRFCKCDSFLQLNRAKCSSKRLINAEVELPKQVQILDLSYNDITSVNKKSFENFSHLQYLNLSNNALHTLDWEAFAKLKRLNEIDLSYNRLEYLDERLFSKNKNLLKINLAGNKLEAIANKPLLINTFVKELNLKSSQLVLLKADYFLGLRNLRILDLSKNFLNNFEVEDFKYLKNLKELNLNENFIKCNEIIQTKLQELKAKGINVILDKCNENVNTATLTTDPKQMFERMIMREPQTREENDNIFDQISNWRLNLDLEEESEEENEEHEFDSKENYSSVRKNNEWLKFAPDAVLCDRQNVNLCQEYRSCLENLNKAWHEERQSREQSSINDVKFVFFLGIAIGVSVVVFIISCALCLKQCCERKKIAPIPPNLEDLPNQPLSRPTSHIPPPARRQTRRRRAAPPPRSMVRYEGPVGESFLSRLFGRPARQQYYRSINQNTATLIRRLSRSNLFNNRLSQTFPERQMSVEVNSEGQGNFTPTAPRAETPPPSYGDVIINNLK